MRYFFILMTLLINYSCLRSDHNLDRVQEEPKEIYDFIIKVNKILIKDGRCEIAIISDFPDPAEKSYLNNLNILKQYPGVWCAGNMVFGEGTIREKSGCTVAYLDLNTMKMRPILKGYGYDIAENKTCSEASLTNLMKDHNGMKFIFNRSRVVYTKVRGSSLEQWFLKNK